MRIKRWWAMVALPAVLGGCAMAPVKTPPASLSTSVAEPWRDWHEFALPGKRSTRYSFHTDGGQPVVFAQAESSASMLRRRVALDPAQIGSVRFSWLVRDLIAEADLTAAESEDSPVRLVFAFDGDRDRLAPRDRLLSNLAETLTGEPMPYATLMYVWDNRAARGSVIRSARTERIRKIVLESGDRECGRWRDYERDLVADFREAFGEEPGRLIGVALMTDAANTRSKAAARYRLPQLLDRNGRPL